MKRTLGFLVLLCLLAPASAGAERMHAKWLFRKEADIDAWNAGGIAEGTLTADGLTFSVRGQGTLFRPLPEGFHEHVDALKIYLGPSTLDEVALLLLRTDDRGDIRQRFRLVLQPTRESLLDGEYVPLVLYREAVRGADVLALSFLGDAEAVSFGGVRFMEYTMWEKVFGMLRSFWIFDGFEPYSINIAIGPIVVPDPGPIEAYDRSSLTFATSVNAYFLVALALAGIGLLFAAVFCARFRGTPWWELRAGWLLRFGILVLALWIFYDLRMGLEFLSAVAQDHRQYVLASPEERTFRDRSRFYDFAAFAAPLVQDRERYELFLPIEYPYFGSMRYRTYPSLPNAGAPVSDTWVVYRRPDILVGEDRRLLREGEPFTRPGSILGRFNGTSFVFREEP